MAMNIDYNRGVLKVRHPSLGVEVYMYVDTPGKYLSSHGTPVSEELAEAAGLDVKQYRAKRIVAERMAAHHAKVMAEMELAMESKKVVKAKGGFSVIDIGLDRHQVLDPDGAVLNSVPLPLETALGLLDQLAPDEEHVKEKVIEAHAIHAASKK